MPPAISEQPARKKRELRITAGHIATTLAQNALVKLMVLDQTRQTHQNNPSQGTGRQINLARNSK
jgi:hypothetical protein